MLRYRLPTSPTPPRRSQAQRGPAYRQVNPLGLIPALETPHGTLFETGAILLWLADTHCRMAPAPDAPGRGDFLKWLFFTSNTVHTGLRITFYPGTYAGHGAAAQAALRSTMQEALTEHLHHLDRVAQGRPGWLAGAAPSVLDYYLATCLRWCAVYPRGHTDWFDLRRYPALHGMALALEARAATRAAIAAEGLGETPFTAPDLPDPPEGSAT